jgi:hypothetical protein
VKKELKGWEGGKRGRWEGEQGRENRKGREKRKGKGEGEIKDRKGEGEGKREGEAHHTNTHLHPSHPRTSTPRLTPLSHIQNIPTHEQMTAYLPLVALKRAV